MISAQLDHLMVASPQFPVRIMLIIDLFMQLPRVSRTAILAMETDQRPEYSAGLQ